MDIRFRAAQPADFRFARDLYFETMGWIIERLFGWDQAREEDNFAAFFKLDDARIILADGAEVGWMQEWADDSSIVLGSLYVIPAMQRRGIGTWVLQSILERAGREQKAVTLAVVKINPALDFYVRHGFRITHEDEYKFYLRAERLSRLPHLEGGT
jgi:GNAT superfamily N-acetyltransferase